MNRVEKTESVEMIKEVFNNASIVIVTHYKGLTMPEISGLRSEMRQNNAGFVVIKNTLAKIAANDSDTSIINDYLSGPTALAYSADPVTAAKIVSNFAKDNKKLVILGGVFNKELLDVGEIEQLAKLPSLDELRGKIVGMINTPATRVAGVLQAPAGQLARVLSARGAQSE